MTFRARIVLGLAGVLLTVTACTATSESRPIGGQLDPNATFVYADSSYDDTMDPDRTTGALRNGPIFLAYDRLIHVQDGKLVPGLALSWKWIDPVTLEMKLRPGVTFTDGSVLDAQTVVASLERKKTMKNAGSETKQAVKPISSINAVDQDTVRITLTDPRSDFVPQLTGPGGTIMSTAAARNPNYDFEKQDAGSGMYRLISFRAGDRAVFARRDHYWDPKAQGASKFEFQFVADTTVRLNAILGGEMDMAPIEPNQMDRARASGLQIIPNETVSVMGLWMDRSTPGLDDPRVRQAFMYGIDRESIVKNLQLDSARSTTELVPPDSPEYSPEFGMEHYAFDPEKARQLVTAAGHPNGLSFELMVVNRPEDTAVSQAVQQMMADVGIQLRIRVIDPSQTSQWTEGSTANIFLSPWGGRASALQTFAAHYESGYNPTPGSTDEILGMLAQAQRAYDDPQAVTAVLRKVSAEGTEAALVAPLYARTIPFAASHCLIGFEPKSFGATEFRGVGLAQGCR